MTEKPGGVRSYVLRQGRMTRGQQRALEELWPSFGMSGPLGDFGQDAPVCLEIGFGMGDSLAEQARAEPGVNFIGVEVHRPGVGRLLALIQEHELDNIRIFAEDSIRVLKDYIPPHSLSRVQIFFPDPWPKKRHHKRRLIGPAFVGLLRARCRVGALAHIATDWPPYAEQIREVFGRCPEFEPVQPPARPETRFERRGLKLGHRVMDLAWRLSSI